MWLRTQSHKHRDWMLIAWWPSIQRKKKSTPQLDMSGCWQFLWSSTLKKACKFRRPKAQSIDIYLKCQSTEKCDQSNWNCLSSWIINTAGSTKIILKRETQKDQNDQILSIVECCCWPSAWRYGWFQDNYFKHSMKQKVIPKRFFELNSEFSGCQYHSQDVAEDQANSRKVKHRT